MPTQVTNYQCPSCTGPLHFSGASGRLECEYCGASYDVAEIEALYAEKEKICEDWGAEGDGMRAYGCPSCGAELICEESTAATSCPYWREPHRGAGPVLRGTSAGFHRSVQAEQGGCGKGPQVPLQREIFPAETLLNQLGDEAHAAARLLSQ